MRVPEGQRGFEVREGRAVDGQPATEGQWADLEAKLSPSPRGT